MTRRLHCCAAALVMSMMTPVSAQSPATERPTFDVVSVKPNKTGDRELHLDVTPRRFMATDFPLEQFIRAAYTLQVYQIVGAPSWVDSERFDITGLSERDLTVPVVWTPGHYAPMQLMMQAVLADRFGLVAHLDRRDGQMYALVPRAPGSTAGTLVASEGDCAANCRMNIGPGTLSARGVPLPQLAEFLSDTTGQLVIDATGLSGRFDFALRWDPKWQQGAADGPSLFTALQEQLGLRLEPRRGPIPVLVIDAINRPGAD